jgi:hypothetical protein
MVVSSGRWLQRVRWTLAGFSVLWAALLPVGAYAAFGAHESAWLWSLSLVSYFIGAIVCHQLPERSFHLWSVQLPVCARCTGIYVGAAISALVLTLRGSRADADRRVKARGALARGGTAGTARRLVLPASALPTLATLVFEWTSGTMPPNWVRALTGLALGAAGAWAVIRVN